jgi:hypothetical protein
MPKKNNKKEKPEVHKELKGFEIRINSFGEMETNYSIDKLNKFLDEKMGREDKRNGDEEE